MISRLVFKIAANVAALALAARYVPGFSIAPYAIPYADALPLPIAPEWQAMILGGVALGVANIILGPFLRVSAALLPLVTFPILSVAANIALLFFADQFLTEFSVANSRQLLTVGLALGILNAIL